MLTSRTGLHWFYRNRGLAFMQNSISAAYSFQAVTDVCAMMDGGLGTLTENQMSEKTTNHLHAQKEQRLEKRPIIRPA